MKYYKKFFGHLRNVIVHKYFVFIYCCKLGIPWRGLLHDLSKFSPTEFFESVEYYQGDKSPIPACKKENGYSKAWQHHKGRNKHHYEYWTDNYDTGTTAIPIPSVYVLEMIADWFAAGRTYHGKRFTATDEYLWWLDKKNSYKPKINETTVKVLDFLMWTIVADGGMKFIRKAGSVNLVRKVYYMNGYEDKY